MKWGRAAGFTFLDCVHQGTKGVLGRCKSPVLHEDCLLTLFGRDTSDELWVTVCYFAALHYFL